MFEQYDAEPAFDYYPARFSSSVGLSSSHRHLAGLRSFDMSAPSSSSASSSIGGSSPAASAHWGQPHPSSAGGSFNFASFSGLAEQLFSGADGCSSNSSTIDEHDDLLAASSFGLATARKASASYPMAAELSAFSTSTSSAASTVVNDYESFDSGFGSSAGGDGSWGAGSPSPLFTTSDLPVLTDEDALSYGASYDGSASSAFYEDAFGYPSCSSASSSSYAPPAHQAVPSIDDLPEWYDPASSSTLSTKSSFDSFVSASSPSTGERWDYYDFATDQAPGSARPDVDGAWGFAVPRIVEGSDDDEGSGFEQWVVPNQLHLPYDKSIPTSSTSPSSSSTTITPTSAPPAASADCARDATRQLLRKQASDRALARMANLPSAVHASSPSLVGWSPTPPAPAQALVARKAPPLRRKAGASSLKASFQALAFASASTPLQSTAHVDPPQKTIPEHFYGLQPVYPSSTSTSASQRSPFSPPAAHSYPIRSVASPPVALAAPTPVAAPAAVSATCSPASPAYPCTPPSLHPYATSPPAAPRAIRKLPPRASPKATYATVSPASSSSSYSSASDPSSPLSPRPSPAASTAARQPKRTKPLFGSTFINFTMADAYELLSGVAPSGNLKKPVGVRSSKPSGGSKRKRHEDEAVQERGGKRTR